VLLGAGQYSARSPAKPTVRIPSWAMGQGPNLYEAGCTITEIAVQKL
jgi:hypothetical protein